MLFSGMWKFTFGVMQRLFFETTQGNPGILTTSPVCDSAYSYRLNPGLLCI